MSKVTVNEEIKNLINASGREKVAEILKGRRDELGAKILYNTHIDEKVYSECDAYKLEIRVINRLLNLPKITVEIEKEISEEELIAKENDDLAIGDLDELFSTKSD